MKKALKIFLIVIAVFAVFCTVMHFAVYDTVRRSDEELVRYGSVEEEWGNELSEEYIAERKAAILGELGDYSDITYNVRRRIILFFVSHGATIVASYTPEQYQVEKDRLFGEFTVLTDKDYAYFDYHPQGTATAAEIGSWHFAILKEEGAYVPKDFRLIGFNDKENKIALLAFHDQDMDCLGENNDEAELVELIEQSFRYNFKR